MRNTCFGALGASLILAGAQPAISGPLPYIAGSVLADGSQGFPSHAYTVEHTKTGKYVVRFIGPFSTPADCLVTPVATQPVVGVQENKKQCVFSFEDATGKPIDTIFNFYAVPLTR